MMGDYTIKMVWDRYRGCCECIIRWYLFAMAALFPFFATDQYFHILRDRTRFFTVVTIMSAALILMISIIYFLRFLRERDSQGLHTFPKPMEAKSYILKKVKSMELADWLLFLFLLICCISTVASDYQKESFLGTQGRYQGLLVWLLYGAEYFMVRKFSKVGTGYLVMFLSSGLALSLWGITDYAGLDVFGWIASIQESQRGMFTSGLGNINTYTAGISIFFSIAGICFIHDVRNRNGSGIYSSIFYAMVFFLCGVSLITGQSDNAAIGVGTFFLLVPFLAWGAKRGVFCSILLSALFMLSLIFVGAINTVIHNPYIDPAGGILLRLSNKVSMAPAFILAMFFLVFIALHGLAWCRSQEKASNWKNEIFCCRYFIACWGSILSCCFLLLLFILIDANLWRPERYETFSKYLIFSDSWGTHRGLCWRLAAEEYSQFPIREKLFGSGLETFGLVMKKHRYQEMLTVFGQTFDSPHNEAIQYLFTTGLLGLLSYYGFLTCGCIRGLLSNDKVKIASAGAVIVYTAISLVNISVPITQPYIIILMAVILSERCPG